MTASATDYIRSMASALYFPIDSAWACWRETRKQVASQWIGSSAEGLIRMWLFHPSRAIALSDGLSHSHHLQCKQNEQVWDPQWAQTPWLPAPLVVPSFPMWQAWNPVHIFARSSTIWLFASSLPVSNFCCIFSIRNATLHKGVFVVYNIGRSTHWTLAWFRVSCSTTFAGKFLGILSGVDGCWTGDDIFVNTSTITVRDFLKEVLLDALLR